MEFLKQLYFANKSVDALTGLVDFTSDPKETEQISQCLIKRGIQPSLSNIKKHLLAYLLMPIDEVPEPERTIIIRSGRTEAKGGRVYRPLYETES